MADNGTAVLERGSRPESGLSSSETASYKCEDCGKIIAAPVENPVPVCCEAHMHRRR
jgi:hypothetical protein